MFTDHDITEVYLKDFWGSYLMFSRTNERHSLLFIPSNSTKAQIEILKEHYDSRFNKKIEKNTKFLYFNSSYLDKQKKFIFYKGKGNVLDL
jgi:hypothetical protein